MKKVMFGGLAVLAIGGGGVTLALAGPSAKREVPHLATARQQTTFVIKNMTCATCPITVRKAMEDVAGVSTVSVDLAAKTARVIFDPARTTAAAIASASTDAGYPARAI